MGLGNSESPSAFCMDTPELNYKLGKDKNLKERLRQQTVRRVGEGMNLGRSEEQAGVD